MGQFSMIIMPPTGSVLSDIQQASIDNSSVNVMPLPGIKFRGEVQLGAVLFPNLTLVIPQEGEPGYNPNDTFIVSGVNCSEMNRVVEQAVRGSFTAGCAATVFPELTIDMDRRDMIQDLLKTKPWFYAADNADGTSMRTPRLVLAGSWHVESDGAFQNQATIFDGNGKHLHTYAKRLDFTDEAGRSEGIEYGEAFPLFVFDDAMVSCAICLDFCNLDGPSPYEDLPADLILVPSYGKDSTMLSHLNTAYRVQVAQKTRTFVVQQRPVDDREPVDYLGYVLPAPVRLPQSDATRERDVWRVCST